MINGSVGVSQETVQRERSHLIAAALQHCSRTHCPSPLPTSNPPIVGSLPAPTPGGLRGKFRVDPRSAAAALARSEHAPPSAAANQPPPRHTAFTATAAVSRSQPPSGRPGGAVMGAEWRQVGPGGSSGQPQGVAAPSAPDPWFEGEAVPAGAALGAQDGDEALDDWEQAAALISDDAAGTDLRSPPAGECQIYTANYYV